MREKLNIVPNELNDPCPCELTPKHKIAEHDHCCQICGGTHTERICPAKKKTKRALTDKAKEASKPSPSFTGIIMATTTDKPKRKQPAITAKFVKCQNPKCKYYTKRHRRFIWVSSSKITNPSCPKCFSHNTVILKEVSLE